MTNAASTNTEESREKLKKYLEDETHQHERSASKKSLAAQILFWLAIAASAVGTVNPATKWFPYEAATSILAAIPGVVLLIMNTFKYDAQSRWHKLKQRKLEGLHRKLVFEGKGTNEISAELTATLNELEETRVTPQATGIK